MTPLQRYILGSLAGAIILACLACVFMVLAWYLT